MEKLSVVEPVGQDRFKIAEIAIEKNRFNQVNLLNRRKNELIEKASDIEEALLRTSFNLFRFVGIYRKNFFGKLVPMLVFVLVAVVEMPLNVTAFKALELGEIETLVVAITFGLFVALMAELSGKLFKRYTVTKKVSNLIAALSAFIFVTICLYVTSLIRVDYLEVVNDESGISQFIWFFMSVGIFSGGILSSFFYASAVKNKKEEEMYFQKLKEFDSTKRMISKIEREITSVNKKSADEIKKLAQEKVNEEKAKAKTQRDEEEKVRKIEAAEKADKAEAERKIKKNQSDAEEKRVNDELKKERRRKKAEKEIQNEEENGSQVTSEELEKEVLKRKESYNKLKVEITPETTQNEQTSETEDKQVKQH